MQWENINMNDTKSTRSSVVFIVNNIMTQLILWNEQNMFN